MQQPEKRWISKSNQIFARAKLVGLFEGGQNYCIQFCVVHMNLAHFSLGFPVHLFISRSAVVLCPLN